MVRFLVSKSDIQITMSPEQAALVVRALDLYARIGIGQLEELTWLLRNDFIPVVPGFEDRAEGEFEKLCYALKAAIGHPANGSYGIHHPGVTDEAKRSFEIKKQIEKTLANHHDPNPSFRGVNYDGRGAPLTDDPDIVTVMILGHD